MLHSIPFICSIHSFVPFIHSFIHLFFSSSCSFVCPFVRQYPFVHSLVRSFINSFIPHHFFPSILPILVLIFNCHIQKSRTPYYYFPVSSIQVRFATNLGYPISKAKWLMIARSITCVVTRFSIGHILDIAVKHKKISHIAFLDITLFSLSTLLCSLTTSFPLLMLYMAFVAVMDSIYWIIEPLLASEVTDGINPDKGFAFFNCIGSFALLGGPPSLGKKKLNNS